jgi:HKD family nuclease
MFDTDLLKSVFWEPLSAGADKLLIISGYATPNMTSWLFKNMEKKTNVPIDVSLIVGMVPYDGLSISVHEGFKELMSSKTLPAEINSFTCSYVCENAPVHSKVYVWMKDEEPIKAFTGSANFTQSAFSCERREVMTDCDPYEALAYFNKVEADTIYCNHGEVEDQIVLHSTHPILDEENNLLGSISGQDIPCVTLSLLSRSGDVGRKSGLNWGQRSKRNKNEAYIPLPKRIAKTGFFPLEEQHFTVLTDDRHQLILRVQQQGDKAITTPLSNAQLGEYFRNRLGMPNGSYISRTDLENYGRTDVTFYKLDEEQYYMDFSVHGV